MRREIDNELELSLDERNALGSFLSVHDPARSRMDRVNLVVASGFAIFLLGLALLMLVVSKPGGGGGYAALVFAALGLGPVIGILLMVRKFGWKLYLFQRGFVWVRGKPRVVLWRDVKYLFETVRLLTGRQAEHELRLVMGNGTTFTITSSYKDFEVFAEKVRADVTDAVLRRAEKAFAAGESIPFGKLTMSPSGLERDGNTIAWADVESVGIVGSELFAVAIVRRGKGKKERAAWHSKDVPLFPNYEAFLKLAAKFTTVAPPRQSI